jgi:hypothetical protein
MTAKVPSINAMGFHHSDGFVPAWKQAVKFAGEHGRIGTMLDVVDARLASDINSFPWNTYFTTTSAEYFGYSKGGVRILIVAHGIGPMSTLEGIQQAYSYEYKDKERNRHGGRIPQSEFRKLEDGFYGEVSVVEFDPILTRYELPFYAYLTASQALAEPLVAARLGKRAAAYVNHHAAMARKYHEEEHGRIISDPHLFQMGDPGNCAYTTGGFDRHPRSYTQLDKGDGALAHLLSTGALANVHHQSEQRVSSLANDIGCHEWWNGVRLLGVRNGERVDAVHRGFGSIRGLIFDNWMKLMRPVGETVEREKLYPLVQRGNVMFTQYRKQGAGLDTAEPEHLVTSSDLVGNPVEFVTETLGYHGFFKYDIRDVQKIMPAGANAYKLVGDPECIWTNGNPDHQKCMVQFYRVKVDTSKRLVRSDTLENDYDLLMGLLAPKAA